MPLTNSLNLPKPFVDAATSDHRYKPKRYSVTEVLGGTCEAVLKRRHAGEGEEDVADSVWRIFGTAVHKVLEQAEATDTQLQEQWFSVHVQDGYRVSGIFDLYDEATKTVTDWKTTSVYTVLFGDFEKWRRQTLIYCWMLERSGFEARRGEIVAILRDHSMRKAKTERDYPKHPVFRIGWDFTDEDMRWAERYVSDWLTAVAFQEKLPDDELEPCSPEDRWHKPDKWAVMRRGQKKAVRLFEDKAKALDYMDWLADQPSNKGRGLYIEHREGEDSKCESYCPVAQWCPYTKGLIES
jgi:hypothetical protein